MGEKPPLGLMPRHIHEQQRALQIIAAMHRYVKTGLCIPNDWINELVELYGVGDENK